MYPYIKIQSAPSYDQSVKTRSAPGYRRMWHNYIILPAFTVDTTWLGASRIVKTFNYTITSKLSFPLLPTPPDNCNFCLCISWIEDDEVVRFKLWEDVGELLYVDLYDHRTIPTNFTFEIWSCTDETDATMSSDLMIYNSILVRPTTSCSSTSQETASDYDICVDKTMDLDTYTWNGVEGDYWTFDSCGNGTFVNYTFIDPPTNLVASDGTYGDKIAVTWDAVDGALSYTVYRNTVDDFETAEEIGTPTTNSYDDEDETLVSGTHYYYWATATGPDNTTDESNSDDGYMGGPAAFPGLIAWFAADSFTGLSNNDPIGDVGVEWEDLTGNGHDAVQTTESYRPTYQENIFGTKPAINFDYNALQHLEMSESIDFDSTSWTVVVVWKPQYRGAEGGGYQYGGGTIVGDLIGDGAGRASCIHIFTSIYGGPPGLGSLNYVSENEAVSGYPSYESSTPTVNWDEPYIDIMGWDDGTTIIARHNNTSYVSSPFDTGPLIVNCIGRCGVTFVGYNRLMGKIAELCIYEGALTEEQQSQLTTFFASKYGITL